MVSQWYSLNMIGFQMRNIHSIYMLSMMKANPCLSVVIESIKMYTLEILFLKIVLNM